MSWSGGTGFLRSGSGRTGTVVRRGGRPCRRRACGRCGRRRSGPPAAASTEASTTTSTSRWPVGCSTSTCERPRGQSAVSSCPTAPGSSIPVTTLTAPSTPIEVCGCTGMNDRVQTCAAVPGGREQHRLGHRGAGDVAQAHQLAGLAAEGVDPLEQRRVRGELLVRLVAGEPERLGQRQDDRHAVVDAGDLDALDRVADVAGRQQRAGGRALGVGEGERRPERPCPGRRRSRRRRGTRPVRRGSGRWRRRRCRS